MKNNILENDEAYKEMMSLFNEKSYIQRLKDMVSGLRKPKDTKEYKMARIELQRLKAPIMAILIPVCLIGMLMLFASNNKKQYTVEFQTEIIEPEQPKEELEEIKPDPTEIHEITDVIMDDFNFDPVIAMDTPAPVSPETPVSAQPSSIDAVVQIKSPVILRGIFGDTRNAGMIGAQLARYGGNKKTEASVIRALRWLKAVQNSDGSWPNNKVAMTGLAILTFLAHGEKPGESKEFGDTVTKALEFLINSYNMNKRTWNEHDGNNYSHLIATYALCEGYGMTMNPNVKMVADDALEVILRGQNKWYGWDYKMNPDSDRNDLSYTGWAIQAIHAAEMANFYHNPEELDRCYKRSIKGIIHNGFQSGGFGYTSPQKGGLTGVGTLCLQFLRKGNDEYVKNSLKLMDEWVLGWGKDEGSPIRDGIPATIPIARLGQSNNPQYAAYYYVQCCFQDGGERWDRVNKMMQHIYPRVQIVQSKDESNYVDHEGNQQETGYWIHDDVNVDSANKTKFVMSTCLTCLQLEVYYRYLPSFDKIKVVDENIILHEDDSDIIVETNL